MRYFLFILLVWLSIDASAQSVTPKTFDHGEVSYWDNAPAEFLVTNNTNDVLMFLPTMAAKDVLVEIADKKIQPGETGIVLVYYYTEHKGPFSTEVKLYTSVGMEPLRLKVKGNINSFAPTALLACPTITPKSTEDKEYTQQFLVIDRNSRQPIEEAEITLSQMGNAQYIGYSNKNGILENKQVLGRFDITTTHEGYKDTTFSTYLARYRGQIFILLTPVELVGPSIALEETIELEDPVEQEEEPVVALEPAQTELPVNNEPEITRGTELSITEYQPNNVLFLIDISKSMDKPDKLPLLKESMKELVTVLRSVDKITVIAYNMDTELVVPTTPASNKAAILTQIDALEGYGWTHGVKGIEQAYAMLEDHFIPGGNNQVIVSTDGVFNSPQFDEGALYALIRDKEQDGIKLSVIGFGDDVKGKRLMRNLARNGHGSFIRFGYEDAKNALVDEIRMQSRIAQ